MLFNNLVSIGVGTDSSRPGGNQPRTRTRYIGPYNEHIRYILEYVIDTFQITKGYATGLVQLHLWM